jgi:hypothetical protein
MEGHRHLRVDSKQVAILLVALLIASSAVSVYEYIQASNLQKQVNDFNAAAYYNEAAAYYNEFGVIPTTNVNSSFAPPISMYHALQIGLDSQGWNKTSLKGTLVYAYLMNWVMYTNGTAPAGFTVGYAETIGSLGLTPPENYSKTYGNGVVYGYGWAIEVWNATQTPIPTEPLPFLGYSLVDATTGQILPTSAIFS